ncbi:MAG: hypothetical protein INF91_05445 [Alphaproteobacteria bacterium]|nr:hypothetical protein [Alphaproteobacteria bacterium]
MGGFYLCRDDERADARLQSARAQFARHGFGAPEDIAAAGYRGFHVPYIHGGPDLLLREGDDFAAVAGTLVHRGQMGRPALQGLLAQGGAPFTDWDWTGGHYGAAVARAGRLHVFTGFFGAFQIFHTPDLDVVSTSFLATAAACPRLTWDLQGLYEFAFNVFPTGDDTVFEQVRRLGPDAQLELGPQPRRHAVAKSLVPPPDVTVEGAAATLRDVVAPYADAYGDAMQCPLSGGLDSRLALALLRDAGVRPHVYVYGAPGDAEVEIARAIGRGEGFEVEVFQKAAWRRIDTHDYAEQVARNFEETDALATDGGLFDNGGNAHARHARNAGGQLAVSGGCGEVFRNFFYLPDRRLRARDVVEAFYARYAPGDVTPAFDARDFIDRLEAKALAAIGRPGDRGPLERTAIEELYPRLRCRAFFGRELSLVARHGGYLMPFLEAPVVAQGLAIPLAEKNLGLFESRLLTHIDPRLAAYPSAYGHAFTDPPTAAHRFDEWSSRIRPVWMRRHSYALRRLMGPLTDDHGGLLSPIYLGRVIDLHFPHMRRFFQMANVRDSGLYRRIATLEYLGQRVDGQLGG